MCEYLNANSYNFFDELTFYVDQKTFTIFPKF